MSASAFSLSAAIPTHGFEVLQGEPVLGGMRNFWGPLVGAAIFVLVQNYVSAVTQNWMTVIGLVFVLSVIFFPLGVLGFFRARSRL